MKIKRVKNGIIQTLKAHWHLCAVSLFFILTGIFAAGKLFNLFTETQKSWFNNIAFGAEQTAGSSVYVLVLRRLIFWILQYALSTYMIFIPLCIGMEIFGIMWQTMCWMFAFGQQNAKLNFICLPIMFVCLICNLFKCTAGIKITLDFYRKKYLQRYVPKTAWEVMHDSFLHVWSGIKVQACLLPIWCIEIAIWVL